MFITGPGTLPKNLMSQA